MMKNIRGNMKNKIKTVLKMWHKHFEVEENQYSEFENSDIEYFVSCLLYNHFAFSKALDTMKTIDLSYDFISSCGDEYDEILEIINSIKFDNELEKLEYLQNFLKESQSKYSKDELYLLDRMEYHVKSMADRYQSDEEFEKVEFKKPVDKPIVKSANPLLR